MESNFLIKISIQIMKYSLESRSTDTYIAAYVCLTRIDSISSKYIIQ